MNFKSSSHTLSVQNRFLLAKLGLSNPQRRIFLCPFYGANYVEFATEVISQIPNAILVVVSDIREGQYKRFAANGAFWSGTQVGHQAYDRYVRHINDITTRDLDALIDLSTMIVLPEGDSEPDLQSYISRVALLKSKVVVSAKVHTKSVSILSTQNSVVIASGQSSSWSARINDILAHPEDMEDFGFRAKCLTRELLDCLGDDMDNVASSDHTDYPGVLIRMPRYDQLQLS